MKKPASKAPLAIKNANLEVRLMGSIVEIESPSHINLEVKELKVCNPHESLGPQGALYRIQVYRPSAVPGESKETPFEYDHAWVMPDGTIISRAQWKNRSPDLDKYRR